MTSRRGPGIPESSSLLLNRLAEKFTPLDDGKGDFEELAGVGDVLNNFFSVIPSVLVVAFDAPIWIRNAAEIALESGMLTGWYLCDGEEDHIEIMQAMADLGSGFGRVVVSGGTFNVAPNTITVSDTRHLMGMGMWRTWIKNEGTGASGEYLITVETNGEVSELFFSTSGYLGGLIHNSYGRISHIAHSGSAERGIWLEGIQAPVHSIYLSGLFTDAAIVVNEGWCNMHDLQFLRSSGSGNGSVIRIRSTVTSTTVISNLVISYSTGIADGILIEGGAGELILTDFAISVPGKSAIRIDDATPFSTVISTGFLRGDYGIRTTGASPTLTNAVVSDLVIDAAVNGLDLKASRCDFHDIFIDRPGQHGVRLIDASDNKVHDVTVWRPSQDADGLYDGFITEGVSSRNYFHTNTVIPKASANQPRYAFNIAGAGVDNIVVGNDLGEATDYVISPTGGTALRTRWTYPNDPIIGDNFVLGASSGSGSIVEEFSDSVGVTDSVIVNLSDGKLETTEDVGVTDEVTTASGVSLTEVITEPVGVTESVIAAEEIKSAVDAVGVTDTVVDILT